MDPPTPGPATPQEPLEALETGARPSPPGGRGPVRVVECDIGVRRRIDSWGHRASDWAHRREAEVEAVGFSPQRTLLLRARVPFHLAFRVACRLTVAVDPAGRTALRQLALAVCALRDLVETQRLRTDPRLRLGRRLAADVVDVAIWSGAPGRAYSVAPIVGVPLVTETALRYQWAGALVPLAHLVAVATTRRMLGKPLELARLGDQVLAFFIGLGLRRVERAGAQRVQASFDAERQAVETTAAIAGAYRVARSTYVVRGEAVNPHDVLSGIRLHFPSARDEPSALHELAWGSRKGTLEALAAERAVQLDTALRAWKRDTNVRRSAVAHQVLDASLPEGHGMTLLSGDQVTHLGAALDGMDVRGRLAVQVLEAARPGARVVLAVNGTRVVLPPDPPRLEVVKPDPTPVAMLEGGILFAVLEATDAADDAPTWSVLPGIAAFTGVALWSRRAVRERGELAHQAMVSLSGLAALVQALVVHVSVRGQPNRPDGVQRTPMQVALSAPILLTGFCWPSLGRSGRRRAVIMFAGLGLIGLSLLERPRWRMDLVQNGVWLPALFLPSLAYGVGGEREVQRARAELPARQAAAADAAARRGERAEWERVRAACHEGLCDLDSVSPPARAVVGQRLKDLYCLAEEQLHAS